ncbi:MAG: hypothetical protein RIA69_10530 [Cyclobacteriaceae bacterium]
MNKFPSCLLILFLVFGTGCFEDPNFSAIPFVEFRDIYFADLDGQSDSLVMTFYFEDGLGDVGLASFEQTSPYHQFNLVIDSKDSLITLRDTTVFPPLYLIDPNGISPNLSNKIFFSDTDNRPPYNCNDYQPGRERVGAEVDTFYVSQNPYYNNIYIEFLRRRNNEYTLIDFAAEVGNSGCNVVNFDGRIPIFEPDNLGEPLSGTISYSMLSVGFKQIFRNDPIKVRFYIFDRALNKSNIAESTDFVLEEITRSPQ